MWDSRQREQTRGKRHRRALCVQRFCVAGGGGTERGWAGLVGGSWMPLEAFGSSLGEAWTSRSTLQDGTLVGGFRCPCDEFKWAPEWSPSEKMLFNWRPCFSNVAWLPADCVLWQKMQVILSFLQAPLICPFLSASNSTSNTQELLKCVMI